MKFYLSILVCIIMLVTVFICGCLEEQVSTDVAEPQAAVESVPPAETEAELVEPVTSVGTEQAVETEIAIEEDVQQTVDDSNVVVTVNGIVITEGQLQKAVQPIIDYRASINQKTTPSLRERYESQTLDDMIRNLLLEQQLKAHNIVVTREDVNDFILNMAKSSDPNMTLEDVKSIIEARGANFEQWKEGTQKRLEVQELLKIKYPGQTDVNEEEARKFYGENPRFFSEPEKVGASHILITPDTSDPNYIEQAKALARQRAEKILEQIKNGADFAEMAKKYSDCPSAKSGGDIGFGHRGLWIPAFSNAAFSLKVGEMSNIVESTRGYHIIKVTGHQDAKTVPFEQAKNNIVNTLRSRKEQRIAPQMIRELEEQAVILYPPGSTLRAYQASKSLIRKPPVNLLKK